LHAIVVGFLIRFVLKVVVIDKGVIAESGTHEELIARNGVYKRLVIKQLEAGATSLDEESE